MNLSQALAPWFTSCSRQVVYIPSSMLEASNKAAFSMSRLFPFAIKRRLSQGNFVALEKSVDKKLERFARDMSALSGLPNSFFSPARCSVVNWTTRKKYPLHHSWEAPLVVGKL